MPRTSTEIDRELASAVATIGKLEVTVASIDVRVEQHRIQTDLQIRTIEEILKRSEEQIRRIETIQERSREQLANLEKGFIELKADHENLKKRAEKDRRQRLQ